MSFKLPDLNDVPKSSKPKDTDSLHDPNVITHKNDLTDSNLQESVANSKLAPPVSTSDKLQTNDEVHDLTDDDFDDEIDRELNAEQHAHNDVEKETKYEPPVMKTGKGIINTVEERNGEYRIQVRKSLESNEVFFLDKEIVGDEYDGSLINVRAGVPIEFEYDDNKSYNRGSLRVHVVHRILHMDPSQHIHAQPEQPTPKPEPEVQQKEPKPKKKREHHFWKTLLKWNDAIGNFLYKVLDFVLRWTFYRLPFMGRFLIHTKIFWKIFCKLWSLILIGAICFIMFAGQLHVKGMYEVRHDGTNLRIDDVHFSNKTDNVTMNVANKGKTYAYYYLKAKIHEQGLIPYIGGKDIYCEGPSVGQAIGNVQKMTLQCNAPKTNPHASYKFDIVNTQ